MGKKISDIILDEQQHYDRIKGVIPNIARILGMLLLYLLIPDKVEVFSVIGIGLILLSILWLFFDFFKRFGNKLLAYIPATIDFVGVLVGLYITGAGNSIIVGVVTAILIVSIVFSPDTKQSLYILILGLSVYGLLLLGLFFEIIPYVNILDFREKLSIFSYIMSYLIFSLLLLGIYFSVRMISLKNLELSRKIEKSAFLIEEEKKKSDRLLLNILPYEIAEELKANNYVKPTLYENATVLFTDFKNFTSIAEIMSPEELIHNLDRLFSEFDSIIEKNRLEKLKTIGDSYMCAGGIPIVNHTHTIDACLAALQIRDFMNEVRNKYLQEGKQFWEIRIGIHTGPVIAGVIGTKKFNFDIWGDSVNIASRLETKSIPGEINISKDVVDKIRQYVILEKRGKIPIKNRGEIEMFFLKKLRPEYSEDESGIYPNSKMLESIK